MRTVARDLADGHGDRQPGRVAGRCGGERLRSIGEEDLQPGELDVPVAVEGERLEPDESEAVLGLPPRALGAEQHQLVRPRRHSGCGVHAGGVGDQCRAHVVIDDVQLAVGQPTEAERARQPIERKRRGAEQLGQRPAAGADEELELEAAVLAVAVAEREPRIGVGGGLDVRDAPSIATDEDLRGRAGKPQPPARPGTAPPEGAEELAQAGGGGHPRHDATVYSPP